METIALKTGKAYSIKENLREMWNCNTIDEAKTFWKKWYFWATHSRLEPIIKKAKMIKNHLAGVMAYFIHRITNAIAEGMNSKIATIQKMAYGYRNKEHFKMAIYFHCGNLKFYPEIH
ncbi:transposase IS204/IS1001/IS1096/IS1165 family protein [mine drainage metagenome]|uniref:Transposase IS204/IS1001/IS1096/IS1165 family protein n=1 Tax=mine drainage metagenome TaxID=410659 RepID=T1D9H7_9ZZZZ